MQTPKLSNVNKLKYYLECGSELFVFLQKLGKRNLPLLMKESKFR